MGLYCLHPIHTPTKPLRAVLWSCEPGISRTVVLWWRPLRSADPLRGFDRSADPLRGGRSADPLRGFDRVRRVLFFAAIYIIGLE